MPIPVLALAAGQAALGLGQTIFSGTQKAKKEFEEKLKQSPQYAGGGGIMDYYNRAYQRASVLPTELASYKTQMQNIGESAAQGLGALADRRSALAGVGSIIRGQQQAQQQAVTAGEAEQSRRFGQLGGAAQMKTAEETKRYQYNALNPYLRQFQASQQKLSAAQARKDAGIQNIIGAANLAAMDSLSSKTKDGVDKLKYLASAAKSIKDVTSKPISQMAKPSILQGYTEPEIVAPTETITTSKVTFPEFQTTLPKYKSSQALMPTTFTGKIPGYKAYDNSYFKNLRGF